MTGDKMQPNVNARAKQAKPRIRLRVLRVGLSQ
jgi:hypothetical protein